MWKESFSKQTKNSTAPCRRRAGRTRAAAEVVCAAGLRGERLRDGLARHVQQAPGPWQRACLRGRQVALPDVRALP